jgi:monofunctional chorismate mutase
MERERNVDDAIPLLISNVLGAAPTDPRASHLVAVRIATSCREDTAEAIGDAIASLVAAFHVRNDCGPATVRVVIFTATNDLRSAKPAAAARAAGWHSAQFLCLAEMPTISDFPRCVRALVFVERGFGADALIPVYLNGTHTLRPDLPA